MRPAAESASGTIYDIGYQRYEGARLGRGYAFRTLLEYSLRTAWGLGRGGKALAVPFLILFAVLFPALLQVLLEAISNGEAKLMDYTNYFEFVQAMVVLFCAAQAPELVSTDQHHRVLPLYFSRPLRRGDYAGAKLLAMVSAVWMLVLTPMVLLLAGRVFAAANPAAALRAEAVSILPILGSTLTVAAVMGSLAIALASFTPRRALASAVIFGTMLLTAAVSGILEQAKGGPGRRAALLSPVRVLDGAIEWMFKVPPPVRRGVPVIDPISGELYFAVAVGIAAVSAAALFVRYARVRA